MIYFIIEEQLLVSHTVYSNHNIIFSWEGKYEKKLNFHTQIGQYSFSRNYNFQINYILPN